MADPTDEGFSPLPALTEPLNPDDELSLQDALADDPSSPVVPIVPPAPLGRAPAYDFTRRMLVPGAAGGPLMTRGVETLATWVQKCLRTRRGESPAVDPNFGLDVVWEDILEEGAPFDESLIAEYTDAITRALTQHPRIAGVDEIEITHDADDDAVVHTFRVVLDSAGEADLEINGLRIGA